jgi:DNA polymerase V
MKPIKIDNQNSIALNLYDNRVSAGFPSPAENYDQTPISLDKLMITNAPATFMIRVIGDSMIGKSINEGDILVVDKSKKPKNGDVVIAVYNNEFTIKELVIDKNSKIIRLEPANPKHNAITPKDEDELQIWGVVTFVVHSLNSSGEN